MADLPRQGAQGCGVEADPVLLKCIPCPRCERTAGQQDPRNGMVLFKIDKRTVVTHVRSPGLRTTCKCGALLVPPRGAPLDATCWTERTIQPSLAALLAPPAGGGNGGP